MKLYRNTWTALQPDPINVEQTALSLGLSFSLSKWLLGRGYDAFTIPMFLEPVLSGEYMSGEVQASERILQAIRQGERIAILGDYDVDGITSCALMFHFFKDNGVEVRVILPSRYEEGYGLNEKSLERIRDIDMLITVDCGITSVQEVEILLARGIDVVVTDHHEPKQELPPCITVNPKLDDYPYRHLAGVGVAYKLCTHLAEHDMHLSERLLELACLGTVADVMPLTGENRYIVKRGLEQLRHPAIPGLRALIEALHLKSTLSATDVSFRIAPVLNAAGRMESPLDAYALLTEQDPARISELIQRLLACNERRKAAEQHILSELEKRDLSKDLFIVESGTSWLKGVLGLAASRAVEKFRVPVILLNEEERLHGSARSVGRFHLLNALNANGQLLTRFGGHAQAAGLELEPECLIPLRNALQAYAAEHLREEDREKQFQYYALEPREVRLEVLDELERMQPFGVGNATPMFRMDDMILRQKRILAEGKATAMVFEQQGRQYQAVTFETLPVFLVEGRTYDVLFQLQRNEFRGITQIQLIVKDLRPTQPTLDIYSPIFFSEMERMQQLILSYDPTQELSGYVLATSQAEPMLETLGQLLGLRDDRQALQEQFIDQIPDRKKLIEWFKFLKSHPHIELKDIKQPFSLMMALKLFEELAIISYTKNDLSISITQHDTKEKMDLTRSRLFMQGLKLREDYNELNRYHPGD